MPKLNQNLSDLIVPEFWYLFAPEYYSIAEMIILGSRKSSKTKHLALRLVIRAMMTRGYNALAMRKIAAQLNDSIKAEIDWAIALLGVGHLWDYAVQKKQYTYKPYNNRILLKGISIQPETGKPSLSGLNVPDGWIQDVWLEEGWEFTESDYNMIRQTVRGGHYTILITGNPYFESIWCVRRAMKLLPPNLEILKSKGQQWELIPATENTRSRIIHWNNFQINTKLSKEDLAERWEEETQNPKDFIVTGYGYPGSPSGTILGDLTSNIQYVPFDFFKTQVQKYVGGVDVGLTNDATAAVLGGFTANFEKMVMVDEYWHSNGTKEASYNSNGGVWKHKDTFELANDVYDFFMEYSSVWGKRGMLDVYVDHADAAFIDVLNKIAKEKGTYGSIKFRPCKKSKIESRIIFERLILSKKAVAIVEEDGYKQMQQLTYEMNNLPWKVSVMAGKATAVRDDSKVPDHITNAWEYLFIPYEEKMKKYYQKDEEN